ncbi:MAG: hypothetical protein IPN76_12200 [Saprospiraceae bacterium]|nr:hypothetical protein [Saprospiraceae bacterium]
MGHIKEPKGVDLIINGLPLSQADKAAISEAIATYRKTGEVPKSKPKLLGGRNSKATKKVAGQKGKKIATT